MTREEKTKELIKFWGDIDNKPEGYDDKLLVMYNNMSNEEWESMLKKDKEYRAR